MKNKLESIPLIGYACGLGAGNILCSQGPIQIETSPYTNSHIWQGMLSPKDEKIKLEALPIIKEISERLAQMTYELSKDQQFFVTIGGDHTSAIGTWSGVARGLAPKDLGLLWIDAHLDSHTLETTHSGNIHGMPLAALLGYGSSSLTHILSDKPKLLPKNVCVLGARSYEKEERELLERLKVRIYYIEEIEKRGFETIFEEAIGIISEHSDGYGISLDLDAISPSEVPGVGTPVPGGFTTESLYTALKSIIQDKKFIAAEIAEFNPSLDEGKKTEIAIGRILEILADKVKE